MHYFSLHFSFKSLVDSVQLDTPSVPTLPANRQFTASAQFDTPMAPKQATGSSSNGKLKLLQSDTPADRPEQTMQFGGMPRERSVKDLINASERNATAEMNLKPMIDMGTEPTVKPSKLKTFGHIEIEGNKPQSLEKPPPRRLLDKITAFESHQTGQLERSEKRDESNRHSQTEDSTDSEGESKAQRNRGKHGHKKDRHQSKDDTPDGESKKKHKNLEDKGREKKHKNLEDKGREKMQQTKSNDGKEKKGVKRNDEDKNSHKKKSAQDSSQSDSSSVNEEGGNKKRSHSAKKDKKDGDNETTNMQRQSSKHQIEKNAKTENNKKKSTEEKSTALADMLVEGNKLLEPQKGTGLADIMAEGNKLLEPKKEGVVHALSDFLNAGKAKSFLDEMTNFVKGDSTTLQANQPQQMSHQQPYQNVPYSLKLPQQPPLENTVQSAQQVWFGTGQNGGQLQPYTVSHSVPFQTQQSIYTPPSSNVHHTAYGMQDNPNIPVVNKDQTQSQLYLQPSQLSHGGNYAALSQGHPYAGIAEPQPSISKPAGISLNLPATSSSNLPLQQYFPANMHSSESSKLQSSVSTFQPSPTPPPSSIPPPPPTSLISPPPPPSLISPPPLPSSIPPPPPLISPPPPPLISPPPPLISPPPPLISPPPPPLLSPPPLPSSISSSSLLQNPSDVFLSTKPEVPSLPLTKAQQPTSSESLGVAQQFPLQPPLLVPTSPPPSPPPPPPPPPPLPSSIPPPPPPLISPPPSSISPPPLPSSISSSSLLQNPSDVFLSTKPEVPSLPLTKAQQPTSSESLGVAQQFPLQPPLLVPTSPLPPPSSMPSPPPPPPPPVLAPPLPPPIPSSSSIPPPTLQPPKQVERVQPLKAVHSKTKTIVFEQRDNILDELRMGKPLRKVAPTSEEGEKDTMEVLLDEIRSNRRLQQVPKEEKGSYKLHARRHRRGAVRDQNESDKRHNGRKGNSDGKLHHHKREEEHHHGKKHANHKHHVQKEHIEVNRNEEEVQEDNSKEIEMGKDEEMMVDGKKSKHIDKKKSVNRSREELSDSPDQDEGFTEEEMTADSKPTTPGHQKAETQEGTQSMPAWKVALLNKKKDQTESKTAPPPEDSAKPAAQSIEGDEAIPSWKAALIKKKQTKPSSESVSQDPLAGVPEWKQKLLKQKMEAKAVEERAMLEKRKMEEEKRLEIAAMPAWKRELYLKKNPQYA